ncbi:MAG TPA: N-acetylglucosamine-6-phosphate deacetylase [Vicinamibacterales bacterium]|nr:N-acetylglucosamine-6-phosphate deacetylase [Vicinamibacterales bacterium]
MIVLSGADAVLADRVLGPATIVIEDGLIVDVEAGARAPEAAPQGALHVALDGHVIVPGFIDVHVHGVAGHDVLDGPGAVRAVAERLPRWGVTAFCPTTVACSPAELTALFDEIAALRTGGHTTGARVLPAHLESNFINPEYRGAQPLACLRRPPGDPRALLSRTGDAPQPGRGQASPDSRATPAARPVADAGANSYTADDLLRVIGARRADVGIVTLASELEGGLELVRALAAAGIRVSLGHSGARYGEAVAAIEAGARHATHLFNRMRPMSHRDPGITGAVLESDAIAAEIICDGVHVHPAALRIAIAAKSPARVIAITDGTAGSGLPRGATARLGGYPITVADTARLADGTVAGSVLTMDRAFAMLASTAGASLVDAAAMCATTPARELGLQGLGLIAPGSRADLAVLDRTFAVRQTWVGGVMVFSEQ